MSSLLFLVIRFGYGFRGWLESAPRPRRRRRAPVPLGGGSVMV